MPKSVLGVVFFFIIIIIIIVVVVVVVVVLEGFFEFSFFCFGTNKFTLLQQLIKKGPAALLKNKEKANYSIVIESSCWMI